MIYFISVNDTYVKIGRAENVETRLKDLQTASPYSLVVLKIIDGGNEEEAHLHQKFMHLRKRGEWFYLTPDLRQFIKACEPADIITPIVPMTNVIPKGYEICQASDCGNIFKIYRPQSNDNPQKYCSARCGDRHRQRRRRNKITVAKLSRNEATK